MTDQVRTRPRDRRASILAAARRRFHQNGYAGTSLEDIAGDLGITAPALYRHFRGKDALYTAALEWAATFVGGPSFALRAAKRAIDDGLETDLQTGLEIERLHFSGMFATEDAKIGMRAFTERTKPKFTGR